MSRKVITELVAIGLKKKGAVGLSCDECMCTIDQLFKECDRCTLDDLVARPVYRVRLNSEMCKRCGACAADDILYDDCTTTVRPNLYNRVLNRLFIRTPF